MIISDSFVFLHAPRTGGTSIAKALGYDYEDINHFYELPDVGDRFVFSFVRNPFDRIVSTYHWLTDGQFKESLRLGFSIGTVKYKLSFEEWFEFRFTQQSIDKSLDYEMPENYDGEWNEIDQHNALLGLRHWGIHSQCLYAQSAEFIGKYEDLNTDWCRVANQIGMTSKLPVTNKSIRSGYKDYYDESMRNIIYTVYQDEFERFGYEW